MRQKLRVKPVDDSVRRNRLVLALAKDTLFSIMSGSVGSCAPFLQIGKEKKRLINGVWVFNV